MFRFCLYSIFIIGNLICAIAPNFFTLAAGRVMSAYGAAMFTPPATALAAELLPPARKGLALSLIFGGMTVSQVAGVPATSWIADAIGWRFSFGFVVIAGPLALVILAPMMSGMAANAPERGHGPISQGLSKSIYGILSVTLIIVVSEFTVYSYVSVFIIGSLLAGVPLLSAALLAYGLGAVTGNVACGVLTDRFDPYRWRCRRTTHPARRFGCVQTAWCPHPAHRLLLGMAATCISFRSSTSFSVWPEIVRIWCWQ
ncbi:MFS transporter [Bradyrhizobium sp. DASA03005]|uniref:MFS transporter n=1 Tax=Bradyrhizobium sp. SPXBL-02 TaxID=3395912 RepID=UPI003F720E7E